MKRHRRAPAKPQTTIALTPLRLLAFFVSTVAITALITMQFAASMPDLGPLPNITPHDASSMKTTEVFEDDHDMLLWGTYRPHTYFGMRTATPNSLLAGLIWRDGFGPLRHWVEPNDGVSSFEWLMHDGETSGQQVIRDTSVTCTTSFVRTNISQGGGSWTARVTLESIEPEVDNSILYFYLTQPTGWEFNVINDGRQIRGFTPELGGFTLNFYIPSSVLRLRQAAIREDLPEQMLRRILETVDPELGFKWNLSERQPNTYILELAASLPFEFEVEFVSDRAAKHNLHGEAMTSALQRQQLAFNQRFEKSFRLTAKGFNQSQVAFARVALSNTLGSIGYWYGQSIVKEAHGTTPVAYFNEGLLSGVPSRCIAPRGFIWDEGFHQLLIHRWSPKITRTVLAHWLDLMNQDGWIPREQILDSEARAKVPTEILIQDTQTGNPPTWFLVIARIVDGLESSSDERAANRDIKWLRAAYPRLLAWFNWFLKVHQGVDGAFRWQQRYRVTDSMTPLTHASGMTDYPRATHPDVKERHLDLRCWLAEAARVLKRVAHLTGKPYPHEALLRSLTSEEELVSLHWDPTEQAFFDHGLHTLQPRNQLAKRRFVTDAYGYSSLFPLMLKLLKPDSPRLGRMLADLRNTTLLWSPHGIRSLATTSRYYWQDNSEDDPAYWRGAVWININYLILKGLDHYRNSPGHYQTRSEALYVELRRNLIRTVYAEYRRTNKFWEHYIDDTGEGAGSYPFNGWTSLIVLIMAEVY
eukprot:m.176677 g.176677  ORF g.176677 m.176677 type:complete len:755 (+) comp16803_c0_seq1:2464-4728(+)